MRWRWPRRVWVPVAHGLRRRPSVRRSGDAWRPRGDRTRFGGPRRHHITMPDAGGRSATRPPRRHRPSIPRGRRRGEDGAREPGPYTRIRSCRGQGVAVEAVVARSAPWRRRLGYVAWGIRSARHPGDANRRPRDEPPGPFGADARQVSGSESAVVVRPAQAGRSLRSPWPSPCGSSAYLNAQGTPRTHGPSGSRRHRAGAPAGEPGPQGRPHGATPSVDARGRAMRSAACDLFAARRHARCARARACGASCGT